VAVEVAPVGVVRFVPVGVGTVGFVVVITGELGILAVGVAVVGVVTFAPVGTVTVEFVDLVTVGSTTVGDVAVGLVVLLVVPLLAFGALVEGRPEFGCVTCAFADCADANIRHRNAATITAFCRMPCGSATTRTPTSLAQK
jgi:hypothetical protein